MKKIFVFLLLMVVSFALKAQYPIQQNLGSDSTIIYIKGAARTVGGFINGTYTDTAAANLTRIRQYQAAQIFTTGDSAIWFRMPGATKWVRIMPATPPSPNVDTSYWSLSGNYVADRVATPKLGTTTGHELNIITNDSIRLTIPVYGIRRVTGNENRYLVIDTTIGSNMYVGYMDGGSGSTYTAGNGLTLSGSQFKLGGTLTEPTVIMGDATNKLVLQGYNASNDGYLNIGQDKGFLQFGSGVFPPLYESEIYSGSLELGLRTSGNIYLNAGDIYTIGVPTVSSTTGRKVALIDTTTGKVERIDPATLVTTPTLQQVLTAGSTLTKNDTIYLNSYHLRILNNGAKYLVIDPTLNNEYAEFRSYNPTEVNVARLNVKTTNLLSSGQFEADFGDNVNVSRVDVQSSNGVSKVILSAYNDGVLNESYLYVDLDSIYLRPEKGALNIDSLRTWSGISDTLYKKPMTWDTRNGRWEYAANWYGGGGGGTPGGSTKQFQYNNAGAFAGSGMLTQETNQVLVTGVSDATTTPFAVEAHEDLTEEIVNIKQSGIKKFSFNSDGSIEITKSSEPPTPAAGYMNLYSNSTNSKMYNKNDAGKTVQLIQDIQYTFGAGSGADGDTTAFTTSAIYGSFYNDADTIVVTSMRSVLQGTSPDVTYKVWYNDSLNVEAGATALVTAGSQVTNTTTGTNVTSFDVTKIPPGVWVWVKTSTVATKPKYFSLTVNGYRK